MRSFPIRPIRELSLNPVHSNREKFVGTLYPKTLNPEKKSCVKHFFNESEYQTFKMADNTEDIIVLLNMLQKYIPCVLKKPPRV